MLNAVGWRERMIEHECIRNIKGCSFEDQVATEKYYLANTYNVNKVTIARFGLEILHYKYGVLHLPGAPFK